MSKKLNFNDLTDINKEILTLHYDPLLKEVKHNKVAYKQIQNLIEICSFKQALLDMAIEKHKIDFNEIISNHNLDLNNLANRALVEQNERNSKQTLH